MRPQSFRAVGLLAAAALVLVPAAPAAMVSFGLDDGFGFVDVDVTLEDVAPDTVEATISVAPGSPLTGDIFAIGIGSSGAAPGISGDDVWGDYADAPFPILGLSSIAGIGDSFLSIFFDDDITSTVLTLSGVSLEDISLVGVGLHYLSVASNQTLPYPGYPGGPVVVQTSGSYGHGHTCYFDCGPKVPKLTFEWGTPPPPGGGEEVPEPATLGLMGAGLLGLVYFRRRKNG